MTASLTIRAATVCTLTDSGITLPWALIRSSKAPNIIGILSTVSRRLCLLVGIEVVPTYPARLMIFKT